LLSDIFSVHLLSLLASATALMASPGPSTLSLAAASAAYGLRRSFGYFVGLVLGTILVLLVVAVGASTVLNGAPQLTLPVTIAASLYMLYLAWRIATAPPLSDAAAERKAPGWLAGLILAIANPKAFLAIGAVYTTSVLVAGDARADALVKFLILSAAIVVIHALWSLAGSFLTSALRNPKASRAINLCLAATLVLVVVADFL